MNSKLFSIMISSLLILSIVLIQTQVKLSYEQKNDLGSNFKFPGITEGKNDITGSYENSDFGIKHLTIPKGWYGSEVALNKSLIFTMTPEKQNDFIAKVIKQDKNTSSATITLSVNDLNELNRYLADARNVSENLSSFGFQKPKCNPIQDNTTITTNGKIFKVSANECTTEIPDFSKISFSNNTQNNKTSNVLAHIPALTQIKDISKTYEYKTPSKIYSLVVSIENPDQSSNKNELIKNYFQLADSTINTLDIDSQK